MNFVTITDKYGERTTHINLDNIKTIIKIQFGDMKKPKYYIDELGIDEDEYKQLLKHLKHL